MLTRNRVNYSSHVTTCIAISRLHKWKRPPVLELVCAASLLSYFILPENFVNQQVIASRQIGLGLGVLLKAPGLAG